MSNKEAAVEAVLEGMSIKDAVDTFGVKQSSLYAWVKKERERLGVEGQKTVEASVPQESASGGDSSIKKSLKSLHRVVDRELAQAEERGNVSYQMLGALQNSLKTLIDYEHVTGEGIEEEMDRMLLLGMEGGEDESNA